MKIPTMKQIIMRIIAIIALIELAIMVILVSIPFDLGSFLEAILDVTLLAVLSTPIIYIWIIKPYINAHEEVVDKVNHMAYHDQLTQLANRNLLLEYLEKLVSSDVRYKLYGALLYIDLDGFKIINDNNGHDAGDAILIEVAKRFQFLVRAEDIVSRVGGDEFIIVLGHLNADKKTANNKALLTSERIQKELSKAINFKSMTLQISSSIGIRLLAPERTSVDVILKDADTAMYRAKQAGKGGIVVFNK